MITRYGICPDCGTHIPEHRHDDTWVLCECGWMGSKNTQEQNYQQQKTAIGRILAAGLLMILTFVHTAKWGQESLKVIPLQVHNLLSTASPEHYHEFAKINLKRNFLPDAERFATKWAERTDTPEAWQELALLRKQMDLPFPAIVAFENYIARGGEEPLPLFHYAQLLESTESPDKAEHVYRQIVSMNKDTYPRTVVEELVRLLVSKNKLKEATVVLNQLSKPNMELPSHLVRQKEWIKQLMQENSKVRTSAALAK
ncbi:MAG: hypothetical protein M9899_09505 [Bdellovibrionaceae bacterium]|nr:hypothetical protein [Pseudobdellovibrionaceae bacterium]